MSATDVTRETGPKMDAVVEDFKRKLGNVRTGRATIGLLDPVHVDYYGTSTPLAQMASIAVPEPALITVTPWDISQLAAVERAIIGSNLGLNPSNDGKMIRLPVPPLNEERRKQLAKQVYEIAEEHRIAIRNIRHHSNDALKKLLKDKAISEDDERGGLDEVQ